jgi:predicted dehydrogenase
MAEKKIKIGLIGCGAIASYRHLPVIVKHPDCELYAIAEVNQERLDVIGEQFNVPKERRFTDYHELLALPEIDAVTVSTRVEQHYGVVMSACMARKHVLCERPLAATVAQGWEMVDAARQNNVFLVNNLPNRLEDASRLMFDYIQEGKIGKVQVVRLIFLWWGPSNEKRFGQIRSRRDYLMEEGGGPIFDSGVHFFDLARVLAGSEYRDIYAVGQWVETQYTNPDHVISTCVFENNVIGLIEQGWVYSDENKRKNVLQRIEVIGSEGTLLNEWKWDIHEQRYLGNYVYLNTPTQYEEKRFEIETSFSRIYTYFTQMILEGKCPPEVPTGEDGIIAMEAALKALDDSRRNRYAKSEVMRDMSRYWVT